MGCAEKDCCHTGARSGAIDFPNTFDHSTPWKFYKHLIGGIPEDILVTDCCLGSHWCYVEAECGMGVSFATAGGAKRSFTHDLRGLSLREVANLAKSWNFPEASLGVAALNAWYSQPAQVDPLGATYDAPVEMPDGSIRKIDAFELYRPRLAGKRVTIVGHFPHVERIAEIADLTVLERKCTGALDTPDPACEYLVPSQDFVFMTGVTIINKTAPRLLDLAKNATTIMVGPSVVPSSFLFDWGVEMLAGSVVADPEKTKVAVKLGAGQLFGEALQMMSITKR
ncbi:MAG: DUF364 domain-containing protein [Raoultibacter sp.]